MADKSFGVKELNLLNASGTPTITSPNNLNLNANTVAISTSVTIGHNLTVSANAGISSLNVSGIATVVNFNATGISTIAQPANANPHSLWDVVNNSASAYRFTGPGQDGAEDNPDIYLVRGQRYVFKMNASGHPFQIRVANGGAAYSDGVTNNGAQTGNVVFNVQHDAPAQLYYQCTSHGGMVGNIYIVGGPQVISGVVTATSFSGSGANLTGISQVGGATGLDLNDNVKVRFGASNDLQLFHATAGISTIMHFHSGGEPLHITSNGDIKFKVAADNTGGGGEDGLIIKSNGAVELYHNNVKKFETAVDRVNVTGHMVIVDGSRIYITNGFGNGAASIRNEAGNTAGNMVFTTRTAGGSDTSRAMFTTDGHFIPYANNAYDLGNSSTRWRNLYTTDLQLSNKGKVNDVDGTWGDYTIQEGEHDLFLINNRSGEKYKFNLTKV